MKLPLSTVIRKLVSPNIELLKKGLFFDFCRVMLANSLKKKDQETILKYGTKIIDRIGTESPIHLIVLKEIAQVYFERHDFEQAASRFDAALEILIDHSKDIIEQPRQLSHLTLMLASCYHNLGKRQETIDMISHAVRLGISPRNFEGLLQSNGIPELEELQIKYEESRNESNQRVDLTR